ncbi:MAG: DUF2889 domain-containing protein [Zoogloeaceae bacterium]|nr:DUF2889 domain-containing protein [Zoogloeaceae bacterium]
MSSPEFTVQRRPLHTRTIGLSGFEREDGFFEIEARLTDVKALDYQMASGVRSAGDPIHDMWVRVVIDTSFQIIAAEVRSDAVPYVGACDAIAPSYGQLVGLNLVRGFRQAVRDRFGEVKGCTHISELLLSLPTAAIQTLATLRRDTDDRAGKPFQLDRCHALDTQSETVRTYYPRWFRSGCGTHDQER